MAYVFHEINKTVDIQGFYTFFSREYPKNFIAAHGKINTYQILYIKDGSAIFVINNKNYTVKSGDIIFYIPTDDHMIINSSEELLCLYVTSFSANGELVDSLFKRKIISLNDEQKLNFENIFKYPLQFCPPNVTDRMFSLFDDCKYTTEILQILKNKIELFLLQELNRDDLMKYDNPHILPHAVINAIEVMHQNVHLPLTVEEIAVMSQTSLPTLKKLFQKYMKMGIHEYFLNVKIAEARIMLGAGTSVADTARKLSFKSQSYFSTAYKRITGSAPVKDLTYK